MKKVLILFALLLALIVSDSASAQVYGDDDPFGSPGGTNGGSEGQGCSTCQVSGNQASCQSLMAYNNSWCYDDTNWAFCQEVRGFASCTAHSVPTGYQGPPYCTTSGSCSVYYPCGSFRCGGTVSLKSAVVGQDTEDQIAGIEAFLRQSGVISEPDLWDFIALTNFALSGESYAAATQHRLAIYRAKFNQLVARGDASRELKPDEIPIMPQPHKRTKAPAAVTASLSSN